LNQKICVYLQIGNRREKTVESEVMLDSLKLFNTLYAVNMFLFNMHSCINNLLSMKGDEGNCVKLNL